MDFSPWYQSSLFRLHEAACLIAGVTPLSKRVPDREELPSPAIPAYVALAKAYVLWVVGKNEPEDPKYPKTKMLMGIPQLDNGEITLAVPLAKLTGEFVSREELRRWILATGFRSAYPFLPLEDQPVAERNGLVSGSGIATQQRPGAEVAESASESVEETALPWWQTAHDIPELYQNLGASLAAKHKRPSNAAIAKAIEQRINEIERSKGRERRSPNWDTIRGAMTGWKWKPD